MAQVRRGDVQAISSSGAVVKVEPGKGTTLTNGTWYFLVNAGDSPTESIQIRWDGVIAGVFTFETCNYDTVLNGNGSTIDVANNDDSANCNWVKQDPSTASIPFVGSGGSAVNMTVTVVAGAVGACVLELGNLGSRRGREKAVITTPGTVRIATHGKSG